MQVAAFPPDRTLFAEAKSAFDELMATQRELQEVAELMATAPETEQKGLHARYDRLNELLASNDAYALDHKVEDVLTGLGFKKADYERPVVSFSGGQQRRVLLAKLLLSAPDVMLLDEPTNHPGHHHHPLAGKLPRPPAAGHDRHLPRPLPAGEGDDKTLELHDRQITPYPGSFKQYVRLRDERFERQLKEYESQRSTSRSRRSTSAGRTTGSWRSRRSPA